MHTPTAATRTDSKRIEMETQSAAELDFLARVEAAERRDSRGEGLAYPVTSQPQPAPAAPPDSAARKRSTSSRKQVAAPGSIPEGERPANRPMRITPKLQHRHHDETGGALQNVSRAADLASRIPEGGLGGSSQIRHPQHPQHPGNVLRHPQTSTRNGGRSSTPRPRSSTPRPGGRSGTPRPGAAGHGRKGTPRQQLTTIPGSRSNSSSSFSQLARGEGLAPVMEPSAPAAAPAPAVASPIMGEAPPPRQLRGGGRGRLPPGTREIPAARRDTGEVPAARPSARAGAPAPTAPASMRAAAPSAASTRGTVPSARGAGATPSARGGVPSARGGIPSVRVAVPSPKPSARSGT